MREIIGILKDKISLSKLALISKPSLLSLHVSVLRTTTHTPSTPPNHHHLATLLSLGDSSRATASILIRSLMNRLHATNDSYVALKCLYTIHHVMKRGPFILKDQLSLFHSSNGRNNLKLSGFREEKSATTWVLSAWVRWYARYIETLLFTSKNIGFIICSTSCSLLEKEKQQDLISSLMNSDLIRDFNSLVVVIEELCKLPDNLLVEKDKLLHAVMELLSSDYLSIVNEILMRFNEFQERVGLLSFYDSVELGSCLERLIICKGKLMDLFYNKKPFVVMLWETVEELSNRIGMVSFNKIRKVDNGSESARFGERVVRTSDSVKFSSGRLRLTWSAN
ncbi:putative clathrin assembly protein At4g40080 [Rutidosis leptorrhynchoides]|uniref:putative clathrin assembly protein At4g40080 n=1 Tax=Rutidosis leptorrhynchoides TaxID=125765 RepID=UPI003A99179E